VDELNSALAQAKGKPVMLDLYADWCVACKEFEKYTFSDPQVQSALKETVLLQANVTANNAQDKALLKQLNVLGCQPFCSSINRAGAARTACNRVYGCRGIQRAFARSPTVNNTLNGTNRWE
jgi:thiol:disulfide interchange protein